MNRKYADKCEDDDFEMFLDFNKTTFKLKDLKKTEYMHETDASGYTEDGRTVEIELKYRNINMDKYDTILIEPYKFMYAKQNKQSVQLYVNFTNDDYVIVYNLHKVGWVEEKVYNIQSKLYERVKSSKRYELPVDRAWIYQKVNNHYKLIQKGW